MRTTLDIHDDLMRQAKALAAGSGRTLTAVVEEGLQLLLGRRDEPEMTKRPIVLPTFGSGGLMPGVDLDNNAALRDIMDLDDAAL